MIRVAPDYQMPYQNKQKEKPLQHYAYDGGRFCKVFTQAVQSEVNLANYSRKNKTTKEADASS